MANVNELKVVCVFCNAYGNCIGNLTGEVSASGGCDSCSYGQTLTATIEVRCESCDRVVYRKEIEE